MPFEFAVMFYIGYLLKRNEKFCFNSYVFISACLIFMLTIPYYRFNESPNWYRMITSIPATIILVNVSYFIEKLWKNKQSTCYQNLLMLGKNSIMVYLVHFLIVGFTLKKIDVSVIPSIPLFILLVIIGFPIAYLCVIVGRVLSENKVLSRFLFGKI